MSSNSAPDDASRSLRRASTETFKPDFLEIPKAPRLEDSTEDADGSRAPLELTVTLGGRTLRRYKFRQGFPKRIGRSDDADITIDNLGVSRHHSEVVLANGFFVLRDLQSENGTFVNARRIRAHTLNDGDEITIGKFLLIAHIDSEILESVENSLDDDGDDDDIMHMTVKMGDTTTSRQSSRVRGYLIITDGPKSHQVLLEKPLFFLGKSKDADLPLRGFFTPRIAAFINRDDSGFRLVNTTSKGGLVKVNDKPAFDVRLSDNDEIRVQNFKIRFRRGVPVRSYSS